MEWLVLLAAAAGIWIYLAKRSPRTLDLSHLPERFVVFDLETTGLNAFEHEIIEFGAIRVNRDSTSHDTFQALVKPSKKVPRKITQITGITQEMIDSQGEPLDKVFQEFVEFIGELPLVAFNSEFDMAFLERAAEPRGHKFRNRVSCALQMARRAWPGRKSHRLADLAKDGGLDTGDAHRAIADCQSALIVYTAAANKLMTANRPAKRH